MQRKELEVAKGSKQVNTSALTDLVPEGYELVITGDLDISDGYAHAAVRKATEKKRNCKNQLLQ